MKIVLVFCLLSALLFEAFCRDARPHDNTKRGIRKLSKKKQLVEIHPVKGSNYLQEGKSFAYILRHPKDSVESGENGSVENGIQYDEMTSGEYENQSQQDIEQENQQESVEEIKNFNNLDLLNRHRMEVSYSAHPDHSIEESGEESREDVDGKDFNNKPVILYPKAEEPGQKANDNAKSTAINDNPKSKATHENPKSTAINENPKPNAIHENPKSMDVYENPKSMDIHEYAKSKAINDNPKSKATHENHPHIADESQELNSEENRHIAMDIKDGEFDEIPTNTDLDPEIFDKAAKEMKLLVNQNHDFGPIFPNLGNNPVFDGGISMKLSSAVDDEHTKTKNVNYYNLSFWFNK